MITTSLRFCGNAGNYSFSQRVDRWTNSFFATEDDLAGAFALVLLALVICGGVCSQAVKVFRDTRRVKQLCPGCGRFAGQKRELAEAETLAPACQSAGATATLCSDCELLVHRLRQDSRIAALFAYSLGGKRKYYAAYRIPTS